MIRWLFLLACTGTLSHAATAKYIVLPSGDRGYSIRCDNDGMNSCYEMAGDICRHGYAIQSKESQAGFVSEGSSFVGPGILTGSIVGGGSSKTVSTSDNGLLVLCKDPEAMEIARLNRIRAEQEAREARELRDSRILLLMIGGLAAAMVTVITVVNLNK